MKNGSITLDATDGLYMPVSVEQIAKNTISVAHYYEQNSDLMADIEIVYDNFNKTMKKTWDKKSESDTA